MINRIQLKRIKERLKVLQPGELPVVVRILIISTLKNISKIDFPGEEHSQNPGFDGELICEEGNGWVPSGHSVWELSVEKEVSDKATSDFNKRTREIENRNQLSFVFVSNQEWRYKKKWQDKHKSSGWKTVRCYNLSDLYQWLESSSVAQLKLAEYFEFDDLPISTLDKHWKEWLWDGEYDLLKNDSIFETDIKRYSNEILNFLKNDYSSALKLFSASIKEALVFLFHIFNHPEYSPYKDRVIVFDSEISLSALMEDEDLRGYIAICYSDKIFEKLFYKKIQKIIKISPINENDLNIESHDEKISTLVLDGYFNIHQKPELFFFCGNSRNALRRHLLKYPTSACPEWAKDELFGDEILPMILIGYVNLDLYNDLGTSLVLELSKIEKKELEKRIKRLAKFDDTPVRLTKNELTVMSKYDSLFLLKDRLSKTIVVDFISLCKEEFFKNPSNMTLELRDSLCETYLILAQEQYFKEDYFLVLGSLYNEIKIQIDKGNNIAWSYMSKFCEAWPELFLKICNERVADNIRFVHKYADKEELIDSLYCVGWYKKYFLESFRCLVDIASSSTKNYNYVVHKIASMIQLIDNGLVARIEEIKTKDFSLYWDVLITAIKEYPDFNGRPKWVLKDADLNNFKSFNKNDFINLALSHANYSAKMIIELLQCRRYFGNEQFDELLSIIEAYFNKSIEDDNDKEALKHTLFNLSLLSNHSYRLRNIVNTFIVRDDKDRVSKKLYKICSNYTDHGELSLKKKNEIVREYIKKFGLLSISLVLTDEKIVFEAGYCFLYDITQIDKIQSKVEELLYSLPNDPILNRFIQGVLFSLGEEKFNRIFDNLYNKLNVEIQEKFILSSPFYNNINGILQISSNLVNENYWKKYPEIRTNVPIDLINIFSRNLIKADRIIIVFYAVCEKLDFVDGDVILDLLSKLSKNIRIIKYYSLYEINYINNSLEILYDIESIPIDKKTEIELRFWSVFRLQYKISLHGVCKAFFNNINLFIKSKNSIESICELIISYFGNFKVIDPISLMFDISFGNLDVLFVCDWIKRFQTKDKISDANYDIIFKFVGIIIGNSVISLSSGNLKKLLWTVEHSISRDLKEGFNIGLSNLKNSIQENQEESFDDFVEYLKKHGYELSSEFPYCFSLMNHMLK